MTSKVPEIEKAYKKVTDASGKVLVEQEKLNALKKDTSTTDEKLIAQSERLAKAHRAEESAIREVNRALDDHNTKSTDAVTHTRNLGDEASKAAKKVGDLGVSFKGLGVIGAVGMLPAAATAITEVAGALQQLSGAALAGPGILAGIAASAGTAALGMQGMGDAFTASIKAMDGTKASVEAANKALAALSPNAADAVKTVVGLKGTFTELRDLSATNMFEGFSGGLKTLTGNLLPSVTRGVDGISKGLNQNLLQAMTSLGSSSSQGFLDRILGNTGTAQGKLTAAIDPIVHAVGVLTAAGSDTLPRLADAVGAVADRFNAFITTADANGSLAKWINDGITGISQLGETALNIGKIFTDLTQAAGGGAGLLGTLESATGRLHEFLSSTQGQEQLRDYFAQGRDMLGQLLDLAQQAGPVLGQMFQAAASLTRSWLPVITQILETINSIPGGAEAVVTAFVAWQGIKGIASVATGLSGIVNVLKFVIPGAAAEGAAGISTAFAGITLPAWLSSFLAAGGSIAALPAAVAGFATVGNSMLENAPNSAENARARGAGGLATRGAGAPGVRPTDPTDPMSGGGVNMSRPLGVPTLPQKPTMWGVPVPPSAPAGLGNSSTVAIPAVSSYSAPTVTEGGKGSDSTVPYVDPTKFTVGDPLAGMPGASPNADPQAVYEADSRAITAANNLAQGKLALAVLEAKGNATQQELLTARNNINEQERALYDAQFKDLEARQGKMAKASSDLQSIFAPLDADFGVSGGLPGIVKNLVTFLGDLALGSAIAKDPALQAAAMQMQAGTGAGSPTFANGGMSPSMFAAGGFNGGAGGYAGDAALLANVPTGRYGREFGGDLTKGLGDCSSAVEDLVNLLDGRSTAGASMSTGNEAQFLASRGFVPGMGGPGDMRVGFNGGHTQATLPGGTPFNWGSDAAAGRGGVGGTGADDPAFTSHYYRPVAPTPSALGPAALAPPPDPYSPANMSPGLNNPMAPAPVSPGAGGSTPAWSSGLPSTAPSGQGYAGPTPGMAGQGVAAAPGTQAMAQAANGSGGAGGIGAGGDMMAMAGMAADLVAPGSSLGIKEANRAIQFAGQAASIGVSGLLETLLPHNSALGDPGKSWVGKIAGGIAGAKPATPNAAGKSAPPQQGPPPGQGGEVHNDNSVKIEKMETGGADGQGVAKDISRQQYQSYQAGGPR